MVLEGLSVGETFGARVTVEVFLEVNCGVRVEVSLLRETFPTNSTHVRFVAGVNAHVYVQVALETTTTNNTNNSAIPNFTLHNIALLLRC